MAVYRRCHNCDKITQHIEYVQCIECGSVHRPPSNRTSPSVQVGFRPHYNHSIGAFVNTEREMHDKASKVSAKRGKEMVMRKW